MGGVPQPFVSYVSGPGGSPITVGGSLGAVGPVTVAGIPNTFHINIDHIADLPKIQFGLDPLTVNPVDIGIRIERIPDVRAHLPANFSVGLSVLGLELLCVRLCGEAQVITEPYHPNPCERCGEVRVAEPPKQVRPVRPRG